MDSAGVYGLLAMDFAGVSVWRLEDGCGWSDWKTGKAKSLAGSANSSNVVAFLYGIDSKRFKSNGIHLKCEQPTVWQDAACEVGYYDNHGVFQGTAMEGERG